MLSRREKVILVFRVGHAEQKLLCFKIQFTRLINWPSKPVFVEVWRLCFFASAPDNRLQQSFWI